ncbi:ParA family protein [Vibrio mediterranei]|uniref:ParA family protein n=1 Tax=Vibrio mediterranei TaxID=689 RepID=A0A3G4VM02_9VIBR|nr:ParA family protein [Vibrio mediterranei]AYV25028.1 ParA family protein [Vibrio mediterranei]MCG9790553.1 ParA family protein [Vibrio mediterranei]
MNTNRELAKRIEKRAEGLSKNEISRREAIIDQTYIEIDDKEISNLLLTHCVSKQNIASLCGVSLNTYITYEEKAIEEGVMQPAIKYKGKWQYTPSHVHAMMDYLGKNRWSDKYQTSVINVQNQKGGTGKSTATISLATELALDFNSRPRVCVIDLDPQGSLRVFVDPDQIEEATLDMLTTVELMLGEYAPSGLYNEYVEQGYSHKQIVDMSLLGTHLPNLFILPAIPSDEVFSSIAWQSGLANGDLGYLKLLKERVIEPLKADFDLIFIDTGPHVNPLSWNALYAANVLLVPVTPHKLDWQSTLQFYESLPNQLRNLPNDSEGIVFEKFLITNRDTENNRDDEIVDLIKDEMGSLVLNNQILKSSAFEAAARNYRTICDIRKSDKLCPDTQLDKAQTSISAVANELKNLLKDN